MTSPISIQLYTLRTEMAEDRGATLTRLAELGYTAVEPFDPLDDPESFRRTADRLGLTVTSSHAYALLDPAVPPAAVYDGLATLGTGLAIIPGGIAHEEFTHLDGLYRTADRLNSLAAQAARHGIRLGYHNHWWEVAPRLDGRHALEVLAELLDPDVFLEVDTYWAAVAGADVPALLRSLGRRVLALLDFANGPSGTATFSFDSPVPRSLLEITGTEGTLSLPDPNSFTGPPRIRRFEDDAWHPLPVHGPTAGRGLGVLDMARALRSGQDHRASGELALHVLETITAITEAAKTRAPADITPWHSTLRPLPDDWNPTTSTLT